MSASDRFPRKPGLAMPAVSLRQIAEACGVSRMTVSRALRGLPVVEPERAAEIRIAAEKLGYNPNQALSRLMSATRLSGQSGYLETMAVITAGRKSYMQEEFEGLRQQARLFHFKLDEFTPKAHGITSQRMSAILEARGIRGVVLAPGESRMPTHYRLSPGRFTCVLLGKSLRNHGMPRVQHDHYQSAIAAMTRIRQRGYRRPGLAVGAGFLERSWRSYAAAMAAYAPTGVDLAQAVYTRPAEKEIDPQSLRLWLRRYRPDVVLMESASTAAMIRNLDKNIGLVVMNKLTDSSQWAGIVQQRQQIGREAIRLLATLLLEEDVYKSDNPPIVNVPGIWKDGESLPSRI